jgi:Major intrinsic protein
MAAKLAAEFLGTFWLVLGGCGSAVLAAAFPQVGIGLLGVSFAFGLTVLTGAYALGPVSGGHFNPAVSVGLCVGGRFPTALLPGYVVAQLVGAVVGAGGPLPHCQRQGRFQSRGRIRVKRLRSTLAGIVFPARGSGHRAGHDLHVLDRDPRRRMTGHRLASRVSRLGCADADPSHQHPGDQHVREPSAEHGAGGLRRWLGHRTAVAVLDCSDHRRGGRRVHVPRAARRSVRRAACHRTTRLAVGRNAHLGEVAR